MNVKETIHKVFKDCGVKIESMIDRCEEVDRNNDGIIHLSDFIRVLDRLLGVHAFNRQQMRYLTNFVMCDEHSQNVEYNKLYDLFVTNETRKDFERPSNNRPEVWFADQNQNPYQGRGPNRTKKNCLRSETPGSLGEYMEDYACPSEIRNLQLFTSLLESFERESGMRIKINEETGAFVIPMGPDLKAHLRYSTNA